ncbi:Uncharacterised protein [Shigella sonnei]|nr:Uncharacterised protein [Shigella sonnei]CSF22653.1 Uncharacterised protein [Shigella sonnei]CSF32280.1 Uncharacterised protein [Shigella sonnei]CSF59134.1 Uncharacterised protein [Shigella sonnei]CSF65438.1 Uncharacterised protein [Shigella sonnei]
MAGYDDENITAGCQRSGEIAFKMERIGKRHIGEKRGVTAVAFKRCDMFRVMAPEDNLVAISCQGNGKSGAVRAGTDHSH